MLLRVGRDHLDRGPARHGLVQGIEAAGHLVASPSSRSYPYSRAHRNSITGPLGNYVVSGSAPHPPTDSVSTQGLSVDSANRAP